MMNLAEYRNSNTRLADFLPWAALVGAGVVLNKDGSFQRTARFRGPDLDSAVRRTGRRRRPPQQRLPRLGSGWAIFVEAQRHPPRYPDSHFPIRVGAGRCRAQGRLRGSRRAFRVQLFPDLHLCRRRGRGARRKLALRGPRRRRRSAECCAASPIAPTAAAPGRSLHAGMPLAR
jgi:hypothetical protein